MREYGRFKTRFPLFLEMLEERDLHLRGKSFHVCLLVKHRCGKENKLVIMTDGGEGSSTEKLGYFLHL